MANPTDEEAPGARPEDCWNYAGPHVAALVDDCCRMLNYATDKGINVESQDSRNVSIAGKAFARGRWSEQIESDLYSTKSRLAAAIQPVTTETLAANALHDARKSTRFYFRATIVIASVLVPLSMVVFANAKLASSSKALIESNDTLAVTLYNELQDHLNQIDTAKQRLITAANGASGASGRRCVRFGGGFRPGCILGRGCVSRQDRESGRREPDSLVHAIGERGRRDGHQRLGGNLRFVGNVADERRRRHG